MNKEILFSETQRFKQIWIWVILLGINSISIYGIYQQIVLGIPYGENPMSNTGLIITSSITTLLTIFFLLSRLDTKITNDGILIKFFPFHIKNKKFNWNQIKKAYLRKYSPIREFGGWGLRLFGNSIAYNVMGNVGLQLELSNKKKILIGTNKPSELKETLIKLGKYIE
ncbi:MAG: hypothetical protein N2167_08950 [Flavobacteriales bacterium]|nr:hypothetical protein [Flavobacteriales bacterium]